MKRERGLTSKKGQVTIFIIIAIVIVVVGAGFFILRNQDQTEQQIKPNFLAIKQNIDTCIGDMVVSSIYSNGLQGGYFKTSAPKLNYLLADIPIYYIAKSNGVYIPSSAELERQLVLAINDSSYLCVDTFNKIKNQNYDIKVGAISSIKTTIKDQTIEADITWPITLTKGNEVQQMNKFSEKVDFNLPAKYAAVQGFIDEQKASPDSILLEKLLARGSAEGFNVETIDQGNLTTVYTFIYKNQTYKGNNYIQAFGVKYG